MGQQMCNNNHDVSLSLQLQQQNQKSRLKIATLYYTQDPLRNTRKYDPDIIQKSKMNLNKTQSQNFQQQQYKQDVYEDSDQKNNQSQNKLKDVSISQQISNANIDQSAYKKQQEKIYTDLKQFMDLNSSIKRTSIKNPSLSNFILNKKKELGQFQNNGGNTDVPTGTFDNKYYSLPGNIIYRGQWSKTPQSNLNPSSQINDDNNQIHGKGQYYLPDHTYIQAYAQHNRINGYGRLININGDCYQGQIQNNKANGIGRYWQGDIFYNGGFRDNLPHGNGQQYTELYTFIGQFQNGFRKKGKLTWKKNKQDPDQYVYQGQFSNNMIKQTGKLKVNGQLVSFQDFDLK